MYFEKVLNRTDLFPIAFLVFNASFSGHFSVGQRLTPKSNSHFITIPC